MGLKSFCGILTLQVGATILACIFFTLAAVILAANIFEYYNASDGWPISLILMIIFVILLIVAGVLMFASAYNESRSLALAALLVIVVSLFYCIILSCFSLVSSPDVVDSVCIFYRCPETFWIANLRYRTQHQDAKNRKTSDEDADEHTHNSTDMTTTNMPKYNKDEKNDTHDSLPEHVHANRRNRALTESKILPLNLTVSFNNNWAFPPEHSNRNNTRELPNEDKTSLNVQEPDLKYYTPRNPLMRLNEFTTTNCTRKMWDKYVLSAFTPFYFLNTNTTGKPDSEYRHVFGFPLIGAIVLFIINVIFLFFSAYLMWSWAQELDWSHCCVEEDPVVIYEDV